MGENDESGLGGIQAQRGRGWVRRSWIRYRATLKTHSWYVGALVWLATHYMKLVGRTNPLVAGSDDPAKALTKDAPVIMALWHGQHLMAPYMVPKQARFVALLSRSADAEINARIVHKFGVETVRGSGGRGSAHDTGKGGARALISLKRYLENGISVCMIADISKSTARHAGQGVILLAKLSGRPIVAAAYATSRRHVIASSWDKTTVSLPFGRAAAIAAEPLYVEADADEAQMQAHREELTRRLNEVTAKAYAMVDGQS